MKIAVYHNQPSGGARRALHGFLRQLSTRHEIVIHTLTSADQDMLQDEDVAAAVFRTPFSLPRPLRGRLYVNDLRRRRAFDRLREINRTIATAIDDSRPDVVLADGCRYVGAPYVLDYLRTPAVYFCHQRLYPRAGLPVAPAPSRYAWLRDRIHEPLERSLRDRLWRDDARSMRAADSVLVNSEYSRRRLAEIYRISGTVCRYGVELPPAGEPRAPRHVLSVGTLEQHKGHDLVVEAVGLLPTHQRRVVVVANDGNLGVRTRLKNLARERDVDLEIRDLPPQAELARAYDEAWLLAFGGHDEPLGLVVLEAMARSVPVVAVAEGGVLETIADGESGFLVRRSASAMASRMRALVDDAALRERMGLVGRAIVERSWAWPERAAELESILGEVASREPATRAREIA